MPPEHWRYTLPLRLRSLLRRERVDQDLDDELRYHVERKTEENIARGMTAQEARREALLEIGGIEKRKEECRDARRVTWLQDLAQDLRYALRMLRRNPGFALAAIWTLALGIGATVAMFSIVDTLVLKALPFPSADRLVRVESVFASTGADRGSLLIRISSTGARGTTSLMEWLSSIREPSRWLGQGNPYTSKAQSFPRNYFRCSVSGLRLAAVFFPARTLLPRQTAPIR